MYLIDTDFIIYVSNSVPNALEKAKQIDRGPSYKAISVITAQEYLRGIYYLYNNKPAIFSNKLEEAEQDLSRFDILPIDYVIAKKAAEIDVYLTKRGEVIGLADG